MAAWSSPDFGRGILGGVAAAAAVAAVGALGYVFVYPQFQDAPQLDPAEVAVVAPSTQVAPADQTVVTPTETQPAATAIAPPSFDVVRVDAKGAALVAGTGSPGRPVTVFLDGEGVSDTKAGGDGTFIALFNIAPSDQPRSLSLASLGADGGKVFSDQTILIAPFGTSAPVAEVTEPTPVDKPEVVAEAPPDVVTAVNEAVDKVASAEIAVEQAGEAVDVATQEMAQVADSAVDPIGQNAPATVAVPSAGEVVAQEAIPETPATGPVGAASEQVAGVIEQAVEAAPASVEPVSPQAVVQAGVSTDTPAEAIVGEQISDAAPTVDVAVVSEPSEPVAQAVDTTLEVAALDEPAASPLAQTSPPVGPNTTETAVAGQNAAGIIQPETSPVGAADQSTPDVSATPLASTQTAVTDSSQNVAPVTAAPEATTPTRAQTTVAETQQGVETAAVAEPVQTQVQVVETPAGDAAGQNADTGTSAPPATASVATTGTKTATVAETPSPTEGIAETATVLPTEVPAAPTEPAIETAALSPNDVPTGTVVVPQATQAPTSEPVSGATGVDPDNTTGTGTGTVPPVAEIAAVEEVGEQVATAPVVPAAPQLFIADKDGVRPLQPAPAPLAPGPRVTTNVTVDTISYDSVGDVQISGRGSSDAFVRLYLDNAPIEGATITPSGDWRMTLPNVDTGIYTLRVDELDPEGGVLSRFETPFKRESPDVLARMAIVTDPNPTVPVTPRTPVTPQTPVAPGLGNPNVPVVPSTLAEPDARPERVATAAQQPRVPSADGSVTSTVSALAQAPGEDGTPIPPRVAAVTVQPGFTLWRIASEQFGKGVLYVQIYEANKDQIRNPDLIYPGQVFAIPKE